MIERLVMFGLNRHVLRGVGESAPNPDGLLRQAGESIRRPAHGGIVVLATCERFEIYAAAPLEMERWLRGVAFGSLPERALHQVRTLRGDAALRHLLRVAAGLDSRLIGEPHVLGQVRRAAEAARGAGAIGTDLDRLFAGAIRCGRRVRNETALGRASATYAHVAVERMSEQRGDLASVRIGIVGTGAVAMEVGEGLRARGVGDVVVLGRHVERTESLARHLGAWAAPLTDLGVISAGLDGIITATSAPRPIVLAHDLAGARIGLTIVDLGMPPNVEEEALRMDSLTYLGLDDLAPTHLPTRAIIAEADGIVEEERTRLGGHRRRGFRHAWREARAALAAAHLEMRS